MAESELEDLKARVAELEHELKGRVLAHRGAIKSILAVLDTQSGAIREAMIEQAEESKGGSNPEISAFKDEIMKLAPET